MAALAWPALSGSLAFGQANPGVSAESILQTPLGARALGMGGAFTAVADDPEALYYNPAGISQLKSQEVEGTFFSGLAGNTLQNIAYAAPISFSGLSGSGYASVGANLVYSQDGTINVNTTNPDGSFANSSSISAGSDLIAGVSYSESLGQFSIPAQQEGAPDHVVNNFIGISGKYIHSTLAQQYSAQTFAGDVGYLGVIPDLGLSFGASVLNVGGSLKYIAASDPLPTEGRAGLAYRVAAGKWASLLLAADGQWLTHEKMWYANTGLELSLPVGFSFRTGYQWNQNALGLTLGFGVLWRDFSLDYAWAMGGPLSDLQYATLGFRFGGVLPAGRQAQPRPQNFELPTGRTPRPGLNPEQIIPVAPNGNAPPQGGPMDNGGVPGWVY